MNKEAVILIPCYDPNEKIMKIFLQELSENFKNIVIVDDGCNKKHHKFMDELAKAYPVIRHYVNLGKGRGIKNGINFILNNYPDAKVIVTADCDGQHSVKDIKKVFSVCMNNLDSLILGVRDFDKNNVPFKSRYGNIITRNILYNFVGKKISDTQTGLRAMSYQLATKLIDIPGERYEYETNVLIETKKQNIDIKEVIIETIYIDKNAESHFNPVKDSAKIYKFFAKYFFVILISYLIELFIFMGTYDFTSELWCIPVFLLLAKSISSLIISLINKHINIIYTFINYIITLIAMIVIDSNIIGVKIFLDVLMLILSLFFTRFQTKKIICD